MSEERAEALIEDLERLTDEAMRKHIGEERFKRMVNGILERHWRAILESASE